MGNIKTLTKFNILFVGIFGSLLMFLLIYVFMAQLFVQYLLSSIGGFETLVLLIFLPVLITTTITILLSYMAVYKIKGVAIYKATLLSFLITLFIIIFISYISIFVVYPNLISELSYFQYFIFTIFIYYFAVYILGHPLFLTIIYIIIYFISYVILLEKFYEEKYTSPKFKQNYRY